MAKIGTEAEAEPKEGALPEGRTTVVVKPGLIRRANFKLNEWTADAGVPMHVLTTVTAIQLNDRAINPLITWTARKIRSIGGGLTRGAAENARTGVGQEAERNLRGGQSSLRAMGQVFAGQTTRETGKNALAGALNIRRLGKVFR